MFNYHKITVLSSLLNILMITIIYIYFTYGYTTIILENVKEINSKEIYNLEG